MIVSSSVFAASSVVFLAAVNLEALAMYGLVAFVVGLIAWSKFREPVPADPFAKGRTANELPSSASHGDLGPVVAVPAAPTKGAARREP